MENNKIYFEKLYSDYVSDVYRYSMFKLKNKENAEDVTSETFLRLFKQNNFKEIDNQKTWIIGITRNIIYEKYREEKRMKNNDTKEEINQIEEKNYDLEKQVLNSKLIEEIKNELDQFDEDTREVLILKIWEEMQFNEIAEILKQKEGTIKLRYYRGIEKLKIKIESKAKGQKLNSFTIPILVAGVSQISNLNEFTLNHFFIENLNNKLGLATNLYIKGGNINHIINDHSINTVKGLLATSGAKLAAFLSASTIVVGSTLGVLTIANKIIDKSPSSYPISYTKGITNQNSLIAQVDTSSWVSYTIFNNDENNINLIYPPGWKVEKFNSNNTYAFLGPNGAAFGYDFGEKNIIDCKNNQNVKIEGIYQKFIRYFDDYSYTNTNWYICEYDSSLNKFVLNTGDQFTLLSKDSNDLPILDNILNNVHRNKKIINQIDKDKRITFIKESLNNELWISNSNGSLQRSLNVNNVVYSFKKPDSNIILYTTLENNILYRSYIFDLNSNVTTEIKDVSLGSIVKQNPNSLYGIKFLYNNGFRLISLDPISPDNEIVLINLVCNFGCNIDDPNNPRIKVNLGTFSYNINTHQKVYLQNHIIKDDFNNDISYKYESWDKNSQYIYVIKYLNSQHRQIGNVREGNFKINLNDGTEENITSIIGNNYKFYFEGDGSNLFKFNYQSKKVLSHYLLDLTLKRNNINYNIYSGTYLNLDRNISLSPNKNILIYFANSQLIISKLNRMQTIQSIKLSTDKRFVDNIMWIDDDKFIVQILEGIYPNVKSFLYMVNVNDSNLVRIVNASDINFQGNNKNYTNLDPCSFHDEWGILCKAGFNY